MKNNLYFLIFCMLASRVICDEHTPSLLDEVTKECNLSRSQFSEFENQPEFKECGNWTAITSIISNEQFSEDNKVNMRCKLYYESLVSMCKDEKLHDKFLELLKRSVTDNVVEDDCINSSSSRSESLLLHNFIKDKESYEYLCREYRRGKRFLISICAKSCIVDREMDLINAKHPQSQDTLKDKKPVLSKEPLKQPDIIRVEENPNENREEEVVVTTVIGSKTPDIPALEVHPETNPPAKVDKLNVDNKNNSVNASEKPIIADKPVIPKQADPVPKVDQDLDTYIDEQAPPTNPNVDDLNMAEGPVPEDLDVNSLKAEPEKKLKDDESVIDTAQEGNIEDDDEDEEAIPDKFKAPKVSQLSERYRYDSDINGSSYFFSYFSFTCVVLVLGYVLYHNKQKVLALLVEGRHSRKPQRSRRPNSANYHKLDSNLEEAISSSVSKNPSHVIY